MNITGYDNGYITYIFAIPEPKDLSRRTAVMILLYLRLLRH